MEEIIFRKKKPKIDYENEEDQDWISYLHENLERPLDFGSSFPGSSWSYKRKDSLFDHEDGLKRPDDQLHQDIMKHLYDSKEVDASLIETIVLSGNVLLNGKVHSEQAKRRAEEIVSSLPGVWRVENKLIIEQPS
ncbi:BON domain-containing protein [Peredibacter sp. HCB2-198]|uniref:BON domain-containing protein n=1 Tax=Peredibacter sp. HCB2-198 TaxID=3383025 RepID=UPI0038B54D95